MQEQATRDYDGPRRRRATPANPANSRMTLAGSGTVAAAGANRRLSKAKPSAIGLKVMSARTNGIVLRNPRNPLLKSGSKSTLEAADSTADHHIGPVKQCDGCGIR